MSPTQGTGMHGFRLCKHWCTTFFFLHDDCIFCCAEELSYFTQCKMQKWQHKNYHTLISLQNQQKLEFLEPATHGNFCQDFLLSSLLYHCQIRLMKWQCSLEYLCNCCRASNISYHICYNNLECVRKGRIRSFGAIPFMDFKMALHSRSSRLIKIMQNVSFPFFFKSPTWISHQWFIASFLKHLKWHERAELRSLKLLC